MPGPGDSTPPRAGRRDPDGELWRKRGKAWGPVRRFGPFLGETALRRAARPRDFLLISLLGIFWGSSFLFVELSLTGVPPVTMVAGRVVVAALVLGLALRLRGGSLPRGLGLWRDFAVIAVLGNIAPFFFIGWGQLGVDSGLAAILMATVPLATGLLAHLLTPDEKLNAWKVAGIALGFAGIVALIGPDALAGLGREVAAQISILAGALCYALTTIYARRLQRVDPVAASAGVMIAASVMAVPLSLWLDSAAELAPSTTAILAVVVLGVFPTALASILLFRIVATIGATFVSLTNYLVPLVGVVCGIVFLDESFGLSLLLAFLLILGGIALAQRRPRSRPASDQSLRPG